MKKIISLILSLVMILSFAGCGQKAAATWQEQYDLGVKYVNEAKYEEAILAFTKALEIDPKQAPVYIALAEVYVRQENYTAAQETLDKAVSEVGESSKLTDEKDKIRLKEQGIDNINSTERFDFDDGSYMILGYDEDGNEIYQAQYDAEGNMIYRHSDTYEFEYYENGKVKTKFKYLYNLMDSAGTALFITTYDESGEIVWSNSTAPNGDRTEYIRNGSDAPAPFDIKAIHSDGTYWIYEYDEKGNDIRNTYYNADGTVIDVVEQ